MGSLVVLGLAPLPEALQHCHATIATAIGKNHANHNNSRDVLQFTIQSVGCAACLATVSNVLNGMKGTHNFEACLERGTLTMHGTATAGAITESTGCFWLSYPID